VPMTDWRRALWHTDYMTESQDPRVSAAEHLIQGAHVVLGADTIDSAQNEFDVGFPSRVNIMSAREIFRPVLRVLCSNPGIAVPSRIARSFFGDVSDRSAGTYMSLFRKVYTGDETREGRFLRGLVEIKGTGYRTALSAGRVPEGLEGVASTRQRLLNVINEDFIAETVRRRFANRSGSTTTQLVSPERIKFERWRSGFELVAADLSALALATSSLDPNITSEEIKGAALDAQRALGHIVTFFSTDGETS